MNSNYWPISGWQANIIEGWPMLVMIRDGGVFWREMYHIQVTG